MTAVLPISPKNDTGSPGSLSPSGHYDWIYRRGLALRAVVALFVEWTIIAFPGQSLPHAWISGVVLMAMDAIAWGAFVRRRNAIILLAVMTSGLDLVLGIVALTEFSTSLTSNAPALLPLIGIELIAYWGWMGYGVALGYSTIVILTLWPLPTTPVTASLISHVTFWILTNTLVLSSVALLLHRSVPAPQPQRESPLTAREHEILLLLQEGLSQRAIATQLHIERSTVKTHIQHIHRKTGLEEPPPEE